MDGSAGGGCFIQVGNVDVALVVVVVWAREGGCSQNKASSLSDVGKHQQRASRIYFERFQWALAQMTHL